MTTSIFMIVAIIALVMFVYSVCKYLIYSHNRERMMCEQTKHLSAIAFALLKNNMDKTQEKPEVKLKIKEKEKEDEVTAQEKEKLLALTPIQTQEREKMANALKQHNKDLRKAASHLKMSHLLFYTKAKKYELVELISKRGSVVRMLENTLQYIKLRNRGCTMKEAAEKIKVTMNTAEKYEIVYLTNK